MNLFCFRLLAIVLFLYLPISFVSGATVLALIREISLWQFIAPMKLSSPCDWEDSNATLHGYPFSRTSVLSAYANSLTSRFLAVQRKAIYWYSVQCRI